MYQFAGFQIGIPTIYVPRIMHYIVPALGNLIHVRIPKYQITMPVMDKIMSAACSRSSCLFAKAA